MVLHATRHLVHGVALQIDMNRAQVIVLMMAKEAPHYTTAPLSPLQHAWHGQWF
jgi:hypothetical protein